MGLFKMQNYKDLEILLLETSGHFSNTDKVKVNFDHHKGLYGILVMLEAIADEYCFASVNTFCKVKASCSR